MGMGRIRRVLRCKLNPSPSDTNQRFFGSGFLAGADSTPHKLCCSTLSPIGATVPRCATAECELPCFFAVLPERDSFAIFVILVLQELGMQPHTGRHI
jgi:hypothetical protein